MSDINSRAVATIAHRVSFRHRKCHAYGFYASLLTALRKRIKSASLHRVSVRQVALTPDDFPLCQTHCSTSRSVTPMVRQGHTQCSNRLVLHYRSLQAQCSRLRSGIVGGVSLSEVLHYARRTQCFSPPNEHSPTSPNHEITCKVSAKPSLLELCRTAAMIIKIEP